MSVHQPREQAVPCGYCSKATMAFHAVCDRCALVLPGATCSRCDPATRSPMDVSADKLSQIKTKRQWYERHIRIVELETIFDLSLKLGLNAAVVEKLWNEVP